MTYIEHRLVDALRLNIADLEEHIFWIAQYRHSLRFHVLLPERRWYVESAMRRRLNGYASTLQRIHECETSLGYTLLDAECLDA